MRYAKAKSTAETILSFAILLALAAIAAAVLVAQGQFDEQIASYPTGQPSAGSSGESRSRVDRLWGTGSDRAIFKTFDSDTLSDLINGKAETYFQAGFAKLYYTRMATSVGSMMVQGSVYVYEMSSPEAAFSVYSTQRRPGSQPVALGDSAYQAQNLLAFVHGQFYVELVCDEITPRWLNGWINMMKSSATNFVNHYQVAEGALAELAMFPADGLIPNSQALAMRDAFSFDKLDKVFTAGYRIAGAQATAYISVRESPDDAAELASAYADFLTGLTGEKARPVEGLDGAVLIDVFGEYEVIFSDGDTLAGVHAAADKQTAEKLARRLAEGFSKGLSK